MATSPSATVHRKLGRIVSNVQRARHTSMVAASMAVKDELRRAGGRMRNVGRGVNLTATFKITQHGETVRSTIRAVPPGVWSMQSRGTKPHEIRPRRRRGKRGVSTPYGVFARVQHPGTRGKRTASKGFDAGKRDADRIVKRQMSTAVVRGFRS